MVICVTLIVNGVLVESEYVTSEADLWALLDTWRELHDIAPGDFTSGDDNSHFDWVVFEPNEVWKAPALA